MNDQLSKMTRNEIKATSSLKIGKNDAVPVQGDGPLSFTERTEKRRKIAVAGEAKYLDIRFV